jgi:hypothetical protein
MEVDDADVGRSLESDRKSDRHQGPYTGGIKLMVSKSELSTSVEFINSEGDIWH